MIKGRLKLDIHQNGKRIGGFDDHNLITMSGKQLIAFLLTGEPGNNIVTKIGIGDNNSLPVVSDTGLSNVYIKPVTGHTLLEPTVIQWHFSIDVDEANGMNISEFGLFSEGEQLFSRKIRSTAIPKDDSITLFGYWTIWLLECKKLTFSVHPEIDFNINDDVAINSVNNVSVLPIITHDISAAGNAERVFASQADIVYSFTSDLPGLNSFTTTVNIVTTITDPVIDSTNELRTFTSIPIIRSENSEPIINVERNFSSSAAIVSGITNPIIYKV